MYVIKQKQSHKEEDEAASCIIFDDFGGFVSFQGRSFSFGASNYIFVMLSNDKAHDWCEGNDKFYKRLTHVWNT